MARKLLAFGVVATLLSWSSGPSSAGTLDSPTNFRLSAAQTGTTAQSSTTMMYWDIEGPVRMRGADVQEPGTLDFKIISDFSTSSDGTDDDVFVGMDVQWGIADNHEVRAKLPFAIGDGGENSPDLSLGWQWKLWNEDDALLPAFALYYEIRLPTGYHSSGVDHEVRGVFSKSITPDVWRVHVNPFAKWLDHDMERPGSFSTSLNDGDDDRNFAWGFIIGTDYVLSPDMVLNADYVLDSGIWNGFRMQHEIEVGLDMKLASGHELAMATRASLDGDSQGPNWGIAVSYIIPLNVGRLGWRTTEVKYPVFVTDE